MSTATRLIKNTSFLYVRIAITMFVALWTTRIILNALGEDNFGIYSLVGGVVSLLGFLNASLAGATQRFINFAEGQNDSNEKKIIFNNSLCLHGGLSVALIIFLTIIGIISFKYWLDIPTGRLFSAQCVYACMVCSTALSVLNVPYESVINAHEDMGIYAIIGIIEACLKVGIAFIIMYADTDKLILYGVLMAIVPLITLCVLNRYCHRHYPECITHPIKYFRKEVILRLSKFAGWNFINTTSAIITQSGLNIVLNHFYGVALNAAQGITNQVTSALMGLSSNAEKALNPIIVKSESIHQRDRMVYLSLFGCRMIYFIFTAISIIVVAEMYPILKLWLGTVPHWAALFCQLQLIRLAIELLTRGVHTAIMAEGNIKYYAICKSVINFLPLVTTIIAFRYDFAPYWMYILWIGFWSCLGGLAALYFAHRNIGLKYSTYFREVLLPAIKATLPSILLIVIVKLSTTDNIYDYISVAIAEVIFIVLSLKYLFTSQERQSLKQLLNKFHFSR